MAAENAKVLIIEDEADFRNILADAFEANQCQVSVCDNATKAMLLYKEKAPDLILSDVRLPQGPSGFELLKAVKKLNVENPKFGLMTGFTDIPITEMYSEGAAAVFSKPLQLQTIVSTMLQKLKPLSMQWAVKAAPTQATKLTKSGDSFETSESSGEFRLGRGGFFLHTPHVNLEKGAWVTFTIHFEKGPITSLEGDGIIRWTRRTASTQFKPGYGVEIAYLTDACRKNVLDYLSGLSSPAFIPLA